MYAQRVRIPSGSKFQLAPVTIHLCWNFTGSWCLWLDLLKIALFWIHDRGEGDVLCCNIPSSGFRLPSSIWIGLGILCIWSSGGVVPLYSNFLGRWCYSPHLQRRSCLSGEGISAAATSFILNSDSSLPFLARWWKLHLILLHKQRTWQIW